MSTTIKERIAKLLAQADDRAGTPEGDVFQAKAFELMAQYDIQEAEARHGIKTQAEATGRCFKIEGRYAETQMMLLQGIAMEIYCQVVKTANDVCWVYGMSQHLDKVEMLFYRLVPSMLAQAAKARPHYEVSHSGELRVFRRSFMRGFAFQVNRRLREAREQAAEQARQAGGGSTGALVLLSDAEKAQQAMTKAHPQTKQMRSAARSDHGGTYLGRVAGERADLGSAQAVGR